MKPRSKRNRKRPRSEHDQETIVCKTSVSKLELDGHPVSSNDNKIAETTKSITWIRTVEPYPYTFTSFAKARWFGRTVLDVYSTEFGSYPKSYYVDAIQKGRIMVNDNLVSLEYSIKQHDVLSHTVHRHEPAVAVASDQPPHLRVIYENEHVLAIDKLGTLPIHPCGGYHIQCVMNLLAPRYGKLHTIHRLDRLTSGLVILGKTSAVAQQWGKAIMHRHCEKYYLARVSGKFPLNCPKDLLQLTKEPLPKHGMNQQRDLNGVIQVAPTKKNITIEEVPNARKQNAYCYWITRGDDGGVEEALSLSGVSKSAQSHDAWLSGEVGVWLHLACPTRIAKPKDGVCEAGSFESLEDALYARTVKPAQTSFGVISYDETTDSTVVLCKPATGRTHQIRLHLQHLGHPIANDPNYGGEMFFGDKDAAQACQIAQKRLDAIQASNEEQSPQDGPSTATIDVPATDREISKLSKEIKSESESIHDFVQRTCVWCARSRNVLGGTPRDALEFLVRSSGIWLHALQYSFAAECHIGDAEDAKEASPTSFQAPLPHWASFPAGR